MTYTKKQIDDQRRATVRELWLQRSPNKLTRSDVLGFYGWLEIHRPELLKHGQGDPSQQLEIDLQGLIFGEREQR